MRASERALSYIWYTGTHTTYTSFGVLEFIELSSGELMENRENNNNENVVLNRLQISTNGPTQWALL